MPYLYHKSNSQYIPAHIRIIKTDCIDDRDVTVKRHKVLLKKERQGRALPIYRFTAEGVYIDVYRTKQAVMLSLSSTHATITKVLDGIAQSVGGYRLSYDRHPVWERAK